MTLKARGAIHDYSGMCLQREVQIMCWKCRRWDVSPHRRFSWEASESSWYLGSGADSVAIELGVCRRQFKGDGEFRMASGSPLG